jgi:ABC-2 type transport system permease protein
VFGSQSNTSTARIRVAVVDEDNSELSKRIVEGLRSEKGLRTRTTMEEGEKGETLNRASAEKLVRDGDVPVAVVLPKGFSEVQLLADVSDQVAPQMVYGLLQKEAMTASGKGVAGLAVHTVDVMRQQGNRESLISFYAAGIGVMFLLFSMSGASGALLEEVDSGTLDRVLSTRVGMSGLLAGKWLFLTLMGIGQLSLMFLWGRVAFGLDLFHHVPGFVIMTAFTAAAAAGFGIVLATAARTRAQLSGMSTIIILIMSSVGGSMFPRFLMSDTMQKMGLVTFNAWALDGYLKVFWRNAPIVALWPQLLVLTGLTALFLGVARTLARRWETA